MVVDRRPINYSLEVNRRATAAGKLYSLARGQT
jgi:hypothetical protein